MLSNAQLFTLINVANIRSGLLSNNFIRSEKDFLAFDSTSLGLPILIPADDEMFWFARNDVFEITSEQILRTIYRLSNPQYIGFKHAFKTFKFVNQIEIKTEYLPHLQKLIKQNQDIIHYVNNLRDKAQNIGAFQTRNIPHFGHEKIMANMLEKCDHLVINPVIGPKKQGDVKLESLTAVFKYLTATKYGEKISFAPIFANMFYAGPLEALHHALLRQTLGFRYFTVGRDHAGAENAYAPNMASDLLEKSKNKLGIRVIQHKGAVFCSKCNKTIIIGECHHSIINMRDISGSDFRASIAKKCIFSFSRPGNAALPV